MFAVLLDQFADPVEFTSAEAVAALQSDWFKPELGLAAAALHMDVRRIAAIAGVEEKTKRPDSKHGRHEFTLHQPAVEGNRF